MPEPILEALEVDLRALSAEARRSDGVAGHISGWFSGPEHPQIKEAAERTMLRLRSLSGQEDELDAARTSKVVHDFNFPLEEHATLTAAAFLCAALVLDRLCIAGSSQTIPAGLRVQVHQAG